jgi:iron-sulfur cluster repair protein YtfE (RIC family)
MTAPGRHGAAIERRIIHHEHRDLEPVVNRIEATAELAGHLAARDLATALRSLLDSIRKALLPVMDWEETWYFPEADQQAGTPWATKFLRYEHQQIRNSLERLEADWLALRHEPTHRQLVDLRARLYALHTVVTGHFEHEERFLMPQLELDTEAGGAEDTALESG